MYWELDLMNKREVHTDWPCINSHWVPDFHLHFLFGGSIPVPDYSNDTAQLHPVVRRERTSNVQYINTLLIRNHQITALEDWELIVYPPFPWESGVKTDSSISSTNCSVNHPGEKKQGWIRVWGPDLMVSVADAFYRMRKPWLQTQIQALSTVGGA